MYGYYQPEPLYRKMVEVAEILNIKGMGRNNLFKFLKEKGIIYEDRKPKYEYVALGYFKPIVMEFETPRGYYFERESCLVSKSGIEFIKNLILEEQNEK